MCLRHALSIQHLLAAWEWRLISVWVHGVELTAPVEKAATGPVEKAVRTLEKAVADGRRGGDGDGGRRATVLGRGGDVVCVGTQMSWRTPRWHGRVRSRRCGIEASKCWKPSGERKCLSVGEDTTIGLLGQCRSLGTGASEPNAFSTTFPYKYNFSMLTLF
jgi:hypothetical protein